jgi:hypothetical protein
MDAAEFESLRVQMQKDHVDFVTAEIALARTFLEFSCVEYERGSNEDGAASLHRSREAIDTARKGINHIASETQRDSFAREVSEIDLAIQGFESNLKQ